MHHQPRVAKSFKNDINPHKQTNKQTTSERTNKQTQRGHLNTMFYGFPHFHHYYLPPIFSILSSSQVPLPPPSLSLHFLMSPFTTVVVSFESKRIIKILNRRKEELSLHYHCFPRPVPSFFFFFFSFKTLTQKEILGSLLERKNKIKEKTLTAHTL